jgi:hypothetical protein
MADNECDDDLQRNPMDSNGRVLLLPGGGQCSVSDI